MSTMTIPKNQYMRLLKRQEKVEAELDFIKKMVLIDDEKFILPSALKKWERISHDMDNGKGLFFDSAVEMRSWFKKLYKN